MINKQFSAGGLECYRPSQYQFIPDHILRYIFIPIIIFFLFCVLLNLYSVFLNVHVIYSYSWGYNMLFAIEISSYPDIKKEKQKFIQNAQAFIIIGKYKCMKKRVTYHS